MVGRGGVGRASERKELGSKREAIPSAGGDGGIESAVPLIAVVKIPLPLLLSNSSDYATFFT